MQTYKKLNYSSLSETQRRFVDCLEEYALALLKPLKAFTKVIDDQLMMNQRTGNVTWSRFRTDSRAYELAREDYSKIGARLNLLYEAMVEETSE